MQQTIEMNLSHLTALLRMSKSLVFVPDRATAKVVRKACHALGLHCWVSGEGDSMEVIAFERGWKEFATICVLPYMTTGWRSLAEQVIWIGPIPPAPEPMKQDSRCHKFAEYMQAIRRVPEGAAVHIIGNGGTP